MAPPTQQQKITGGGKKKPKSFMTNICKRERSGNTNDCTSNQKQTYCKVSGCDQANEEGGYCCPGSLLWKKDTDKKKPILEEILKAEIELNEHVLNNI
jgi:hypothetical protein